MTCIGCGKSLVNADSLVRRSGASWVWPESNICVHCLDLVTPHVPARMVRGDFRLTSQGRVWRIGFFCGMKGNQSTPSGKRSTASPQRMSNLRAMQLGFTAGELVAAQSQLAEAAT